MNCHFKIQYYVFFIAKLGLLIYRLQAIEDGKEISSEDETILEKQVEKSTIELLTLTHEGKELVRFIM